MVRPIAILLIVLVIIVAIGVPIALFVRQDDAAAAGEVVADFDVDCYPEFDADSFKADPSSCYSDNLDKAYRWYGPKTDYALATGLKDTNVSEFTIPGCTPVMLYLFCRHGARYPDLGDLESMEVILNKFRNLTLDAHKKGKSHLCRKDIEELQKWKFPYEFSEASQSMTQGYLDLHMLAERFQKMFPSLLPGTYSPSTYKFGVSNRDRTNQSLWAFAEILFNSTEFEKIEYPRRDLKRVAFHKTCERLVWPNRSKPSREMFVEPEAFRKSPVAQRLVKNIKAKLGIEADLTYSEVRNVAIECAVAYTAFRAAPWCAIFSKDDLLVTEYDDDIYDFHKDSYGRPLNPKMGCPVVNEITQLFSKAADVKKKNDVYKSVLYFAHSRDYKKLLGTFDLYRGDDPLTAAGYCSENVRNRLWRDAIISPYGANLAFILFNCNGKHRVLALVNERPVQLPRCSYRRNDMLCDLDEFIAKYHFPNCDAKKICTPNAKNEQWPDSHWEDAYTGAR